LKKVKKILKENKIKEMKKLKLRNQEKNQEGEKSQLKVLVVHGSNIKSFIFIILVNLIVTYIVVKRTIIIKNTQIDIKKLTKYHHAENLLLKSIRKE